MAIILIILVIVVGILSDAKDQHDVNKWRNSGGMAKDWDCWSNDGQKDFMDDFIEYNIHT